MLTYADVCCSMRRCLESGRGAPLEVLSLLLYWYKSTNTDGAEVLPEAWTSSEHWQEDMHNVVRRILCARYSVYYSVYLLY
jgi:hypothetical protein